jgi:maltoporin
MKARLIAVIFFLFFVGSFFANDTIKAQQITNKAFSFGSYGRVGVGYSPTITGNTSRQLNLLGMGSIGGRLEEQDYVELIAALHFKPVSKQEDTTEINVQTRMALFSAGSQFIGNITTASFRGLTISLPELYVEANHIRGSKWSTWIGAKFFRDNDIHIADHFYFDDHSSQGFGLKYDKTSFAVLFPAAVDTNASYPPYFYTNIVNGTASLALRQRTVLVLEHLIALGANKSTLKLLGEFHQLSDATAEEASQAGYNYPSDKGWVLGVKHSIDLKTKKNRFV